MAILFSLSEKKANNTQSQNQERRTKLLISVRTQSVDSLKPHSMSTIAIIGVGAIGSATAASFQIIKNKTTSNTTKLFFCTRRPISTPLLVTTPSGPVSVEGENPHVSTQGPIARRLGTNQLQKLTTPPAHHPGSHHSSGHKHASL